MEAQDEQVYGWPPGPDVTAALLDFARLAQGVGAAVADESGLIAMKLLERLLALCVAPKGAVLLTAQNLTGPKQSSLSSLSSQKMFRPFALSGMSEEESAARLVDFAFDGADIQVPPGAGEASWLICRLPVTLPLMPGQDLETLQYITEHPSETILPLYALIVLEWTIADECARVNMIERVRTVLPRVAEAFGAALLNVLLAERIHELEVAADREALREMELLKSELLATVSHELRSPLSSIKGYAATLLRHERRISREERHEFLLAINEASDRLEVIVDRLLEVSQLETGTITIDRASVNLVHLAREAIQAVEERLQDLQEGVVHSQARHFTFAVNVEDMLGRSTDEVPLLHADRQRLREVLDNLLENAMNYSPAGGAIEIGIRPVTAQSQKEHNTTLEQSEAGKRSIGLQPLLHRNQHMLEMAICDKGIGIPPGQLQSIFDRFHRVDTRLTREVNGLGLGLAICKHIIELHNGMIWAESEFGKGSTFHIWLPINMAIK